MTHNTIYNISYEPEPDTIIIVHNHNDCTIIILFIIINIVLQRVMLKLVVTIKFDPQWVPVNYLGNWLYSIIVLVLLLSNQRRKLRFV